MIIKRCFPFVIAGAMLLASCMSSTRLQVLKSADIFVPEHIQKVAVVSRIKPAQGDKVMNVIEGILTGEALFEDRLAAPECLLGLRDMLTRTPRFSVVQPPLELEGTGGSYLPPALPWEQVEKLCVDNGTDALITLELFDSDVATSFAEKPVKVKNKEGVETTIIEHYATMRITVRAGWRFYDPVNKRIIDEAQRSDYQEFGGRGNNRAGAEAALLARNDAIRKAGFYAGNQYGSHISPSWITLTRAYYRKGSDLITEGHRKADINDWKGAAEIWKKETTNSDKKIAGRAAYNIAIACEVEGKLDLALEWAKKAYTEFGNNQAQHYIHQLNYRIEEVKRVEEQMRKQ